MNTAISETVSEITVKPISLRATERGLHRGFAFSMWRTMFSIITMASSTTKPVPIVNAISDRLSRLKPEKYMMPKLEISDSGSATPAISVARRERRNSEHHERDQHHAQDQRELHVMDRGANGHGTVADHVEVHARPECARSFGISARIWRDDFDDVGAGLPLDIDDDGGRALVPAAGAIVLQAVDTIGDVADGNRRAVAIGDDDGLVGLRRRDLVVGGNGVGLLRAVERSLRPGNVGARDRVAQILHGNAIGREPRQVGLHPHRRLQPAQHRNAPDAGKLR